MPKAVTGTTKAGLYVWAGDRPRPNDQSPIPGPRRRRHRVHVRVDPLSAPRRTATIAGFCEDLPAPKAVYDASISRSESPILQTLIPPGTRVAVPAFGSKNFTGAATA